MQFVTTRLWQFVKTRTDFQSGSWELWRSLYYFNFYRLTLACLSAGEVSPAAWPILRAVVDDAVAIDDGTAIDMMIGLAHGRWGDAALVSGESGCASVAAVLALADQPDLRTALGLTTQSRVLCIGSEGATAPDLWASVTGVSLQDAAAA